MSSYMLLLYDEPDTFLKMSPEEIQKTIERYGAWAQSLREAGKLLDSHKLTDGAGRVLSRQEGRVRILDGPFCETKEVIGGYFTVTAESYEEAVEIAKDSPHLDFGTVEVREVER